MNKISCTLVAASLVVVTAGYAAERAGKNKATPMTKVAFMPQNDDFNASVERAAQGGSSPGCCAADFNCDGIVNGADLGQIVAAWGPCSGDCPADLNNDNAVNGADLGEFLGEWGDCTG